MMGQLHMAERMRGVADKHGADIEMREHNPRELWLAFIFEAWPTKEFGNDVFDVVFEEGWDMSQHKHITDGERHILGVRLLDTRRGVA